MSCYVSPLKINFLSFPYFHWVWVLSRCASHWRLSSHSTLSQLKYFNLRLSLLPFLALAAAYPPGYIGYLKDFPEARNFADFTFFQTVNGMLQKVGPEFCYCHHRLQLACREQQTTGRLRGPWSSPRTCSRAPTPSTPSGWEETTWRARTTRSVWWRTAQPRSALPHSWWVSARSSGDN